MVCRFSDNRIMRAILYLILISSVFPAALAAQAAGPYEQYLREQPGSQHFEKEEWEKAKEGLDFSEAAVKKEAPKPEEAPAGGEQGQQDGPPPRERSNVEVNPQLASGLLKFFSILILAIVLALILRGVLGLENNPRNKKIGKEKAGNVISLEKIEENIHESDLEAYIRRALEQEQYALALRLYYLSILKELSLRKAIHWKRDKTNRQYVLEMQRSPLGAAFEEATRIFEQAWYGGRQLGKEEYRALEPGFRKLAGRIKAG